MRQNKRDGIKLYCVHDKYRLYYFSGFCQNQFKDPFLIFEKEKRSIKKSDA